MPNATKCPYCGKQPHDGLFKCPMVGAVEYHADGSIKRVEKARPAAEVGIDNSLFGRVFGPSR